jgi:hypothetical protein
MREGERRNPRTVQHNTHKNKTHSAQNESKTVSTALPKIVRFLLLFVSPVVSRVTTVAIRELVVFRFVNFLLMNEFVWLKTEKRGGGEGEGG